MSGRKSRGQGATEYLVVLGAVLLVAIVGITAINQAASTGALKEQQSTAYWKAATPFSILAYNLNENGLSVKLANNQNQKIKLTSIKVTYNGVNYSIYSGSVVFASGEQVELTNIDLRFSPANPCNALSSGSVFEYTQVIFGYDKQDIAGFYQTGDKPLVGRCGQQASLVSVSGSSPQSGGTVAQNVSLNLTMQSPSLAAMNFSFNGTSSSFYDDSLVLALDFEDNTEIGDNDTNAADVSRYGNNGSIYDNTIGIWRFDETDNTTAKDSSRFGNNGILYGPTVGLWRFDEGDNTTVSDASNWGNNGTLYGSTVALWRFDDGDNTTARDASVYDNNGTLYGNTIALWRFDEGDNITTRDASSYGNNGRLYGNTIGLWRFDENTGASANDSTAYGNNATCQTALVNANCNWTTGKSNSAIIFNGKNSTVNLPSALATNYSSLSVSLWTKTTQIAAPGGVNRSFTTYSGEGSTYFSIGQFANKATVGWSGWGVRNVTSNGTGINDGNWHHIVAIKNASAVWLYQDGALVGSNLSTTIANMTSVISPTIGGFNSTGTAMYCWNGSIDEVQMINSTITQADVAALYNAGKAKFLEWHSSGKSGGALNFDGIGSYVNMGSSLNSLGNYSTIAFWANPASFTIGALYRGILSWKAQTGTPNIRISTSGVMQARLYDLETYSSGANATIGMWDFWAFVTSNQTWSWYKNGQLTATGTTTYPANYSGNLTIGLYQGFANWNGSIDEVQIINHSLSASEIATLYNAGKAKFMEWTTGKSGTGLQFDGIQAYIDAGNSSSLNIAGPLSISMWMKSEYVPTTNARILQKSSLSYSLFELNTGSLAFGHNSGFIKSAANYIDGSWHHVVGVYNGTPAFEGLSLYVDGRLEPTNEDGVFTGFTLTTSNLTIGSQAITPGKYFNGSIDEVAIYNRTLSPSDVLDLYNAGKAKFAEWNSSGKSGSALNFDNNTYASLDYGTSLNITGALTLSAWVYPTVNDSFYRGIFGSGQIQDTTHCRYLFFFRNGTLFFEISNGSARHPVAYTLPSLSTWYHMIGVWDGTNATDAVRLYINGENVASTMANFTSITSFRPWYIGRDTWSGTTRRFIGMVDEAQAVNYALNATEVANLYSAGKAKFVEHVPWGKSGSALRFDGNRNYVNLGNSTDLDVVNNRSFTMLAWFKAPSSTSHRVIVSRGRGNPYDWNGYEMGISTNHQLRVTSSTPLAGTGIVTFDKWGTAIVDDNNWHLGAFSYNGTNGTLYVDGVNDGSATGYFVSSNQSNYIGKRMAGSYFNGTIDEVEIINRTLSASEIAAIYNSGKARRDSWTSNGRQDSATGCDGLDDYVELTDNQYLRMTDGGTISAWVYPRELNNNGRIIDKSTATNSANGYAVYTGSTSVFGFRVNADTTTSSNTVFTTDEWQHITIVFNSTQRTIYRNGVNVTSSGAVSTNLPPDVAGTVAIGNRAGATDRPFNGSIDQVRAWNRVLSASEIAQNYYGSLTKYAPDSWLFSYNRTLVPAGTYYYYGYVRNTDGQFDYTDNRSITVTG